MTTGMMQRISIIRVATVRERSPLTQRRAAFASGPIAAFVSAGGRLAILVVCILVSTAGCSKGRAYRLGHDAEARGESHVAYAYYCQAAVRRPGNGEISASIKRLNPAAATFWRQQAREAASRGRHTDAWRMAMRCLRVQPDDADAAALVKELESEHSTAVASARQDYERRGPRTLAVAPLRSAKDEMPRGLASDSLDVGKEALTAAALGGVGRSTGTAPPAGLHVLANNTRIDRETGKSRPLLAETNRLRPPLDRDGRMAPPHEGAIETPRRPEQDERVQPPLARASRMRPLADEHEPGAAVAMTLSRGDKRYARRAGAMDGLSVRLRDTDKDPEADLDIYANDKRIRKIRDLRPGQSETFTTPSGTAYSLSLLSVNHPTRTVCIVIKAR